jgi:sarcosine oxidase subunit gamma
MRSPLSHRTKELTAVAEGTLGAVKLTEAPLLTQIDVRLAPGARRADGSVVDLDGTMPETPNRSKRVGRRETLWLGPDEWLVVAPTSEGIELVAEMERTLEGVHHSVVDVSSNRAVLDVGGPRTLELLSKGCSLDLHPSRWANGACAQTSLARTHVILQRRDAEMRVFVRASFADYLVDWLLDAAREYLVGRSNGD